MARVSISTVLLSVFLATLACAATFDSASSTLKRAVLEDPQRTPDGSGDSIIQLGELSYPVSLGIIIGCGIIILIAGCCAGLVFGRLCGDRCAHPHDEHDKPLQFVQDQYSTVSTGTGTGTGARGTWF